MRFKTNVFAGYKVLLVFTHDSIIMCWMLNLNFGVEHLAFNVNQQHIWATHFNFQIGVVSYVTKKVYVVAINASGSKMCKFNPNLKKKFTLFIWNLEGHNLTCIDVVVIQVVGVVDCLATKLQGGFLALDVMDSLGVVYPQYWLQSDVDENFNKHLNVIKATFCSPKKLAGSDVWVLEVMSTSSLNIEQFIFKLAMNSNACTTMAKRINVNPLPHLWHTISTSKLFTYSFLEYFKLVEIAMVQVIGSVKDERCFISLAFGKSKLCNRLRTNLGLVVKMFSKKFYILQNFPHAKAFEQWWIKCPRYGVGAQASFQQFIDAKIGSWTYPCVLATLHVAICKGLLVFLCMGIGESIMNTSVHFQFTTIPFVFICLRALGFWVSEMVIPNGYHFLFNLLFPSSILI